MEQTRIEFVTGDDASMTKCLRYYFASKTKQEKLRGPKKFYTFTTLQDTSLLHSGKDKGREKGWFHFIVITSHKSGGEGGRVLPPSLPACALPCVDGGRWSTVPNQTHCFGKRIFLLRYKH